MQPSVSLTNRSQAPDHSQEMQHHWKADPRQAFRRRTGIILPKHLTNATTTFTPLTYKTWLKELSCPSLPDNYEPQHKFKFLKEEPPLGAEGWQPADFLRYTVHCTSQQPHTPPPSTPGTLLTHNPPSPPATN